MISKKEYTILLGDDSELDLMFAEEVLKSHSENYEILIAYDGLEVCEKAISQYPDIIFVDINLPQMNGIDVIRFLKSNHHTQHIPLLVITARNNFQEAFDAGATDFIQKPLTRNNLIIRTRSALNLVDSYRAIEKQKLEIEKRNHKIIRQHESVLRQKEIINRKDKEITADLKYAKRIQDAILPKQSLFSEIFPQHFILNIPKHFVSGDFYWVEKKENKAIIAVGDCTGHGVSGALMHMMALIFLNQVIKNKSLENPNEILEALRDYVISSLHQTGGHGETHDGMDMALCIIDYTHHIIKFAGANNPLYIVNNKGLREIKGDRIPVGINFNYNKPFTTHEIKVDKGDTLYLFTDGFPDQFGGPKGKKFRYKYFKELLIGSNGTALKKQKEILEQTFHKWKEGYEQLDDVLVVGIKIG
ncbi:MAG: SpoIIE family protein phosphatase [Bacteroidales bacterium]|nr:SpoIIE family protein phosphatase [Bacteroidales bacterium]MBS3775218.1 SpoIIE family protein phosphatase [Bacteroidales bacterium]